MTTATENTVNNRVKEYEGYLATYISKGAEAVEEVKYRFEGDQWKLGKAQMLNAGLDPFALKEAFLKACDFFGIERPLGYLVEESETNLDAPFWETGVNPVTMTKVECYASAEIPDDTFVEYDYTF